MCLEFTAPTELKITNDDAPPENNCNKTICEAPPKITIESPTVIKTPIPSSIPITPYIIPNGNTGIIKGLTSIIPFDKVFNSFSNF